MKTGFKIGLIETGKSHFGVHGDEERVEIFGVVVFVFEARDGFSGWSDGSSEIDGDSVFASLDGTGGELDVAVINFCGDGDVVDREFCQGAFAKIQKNGGGRVGMKSEIFVAGSRRRVRNEREDQMIAYVRELRGTLAREITRNAVGRRRCE